MLYVYYSGLLLQRIIKQKKLCDIWRQLKYKFPSGKADTLNVIIGKGRGGGVNPRKGWNVSLSQLLERRKPPT